MFEAYSQVQYKSTPSKEDPREHLRYLTRKMLKKVPHNEEIDMDEEATKTNQMIVYATAVCGQGAISFLLAFVQKTEEEELLKCMAHILYMMSGDSGYQVLYLLTVMSC